MIDQRPKVPTLPDRIVYLLVSEGGGQDGLDHTDKGGQIVAASFLKTDIERRKGLDSRYRIERRIVDDSDVRKALAKLDRVEMLLVFDFIDQGHEPERCRS